MMKKLLTVPVLLTISAIGILGLLLVFLSIHHNLILATSELPAWEWNFIPKDRHCPNESVQEVKRGEWEIYNLKDHKVEDDRLPCYYSGSGRFGLALSVVDAWGRFYYKGWFLSLNHPGPLQEQQVSIGLIHPIYNSAGWLNDVEKFTAMVTVKAPSVNTLTLCRFEEVLAQDEVNTFPLMVCDRPQDMWDGDSINQFTLGGYTAAIAMNHQGELFWELVPDN